jgi:hypothetical protein
MLHEFLTSNRDLLIQRCKERVARRFEPIAAPGTIDHGVPLFLEQLVETLQEEQRTHVRSSDSEPTPAHTPIGRAAALHGAELLRRGLAVDQHVAISTDEFRTLNRCLDNAIADAVASFGAARQTSIDRQTETLQQLLTAFSQEHHRLSDIAIQSLAAIKTGNIGISGATGTLLGHALEELRTLNERDIPDILHSLPGTKGAPG